MEFDYQLDKRLLLLGLAPFFEQLPENHSVHRVISFLKVDQQVELALFGTMDFIQESTGMNGSGLAFFEASLVDLRLNQMWRLRLDSLKYCFLHNLRQMRSHHNWSDVVQATWTLSVSFLERNESPNSEIVWDPGVVECVGDFSHNFDSQLIVLCQ